MNALILAAGYATRPVSPHPEQGQTAFVRSAANQSLNGWRITLLAIPDLGTIFIVTNDKFAKDFQAWADDYQKRNPKARFKIVNDGSTDDNNKLGAIGDINLVLTRENLIETDLLVLAGDNLFSDSLSASLNLPATPKRPWRCLMWAMSKR